MCWTIMEKERREDLCLFLPVYLDVRPTFMSLLASFDDSIHLDIFGSLFSDASSMV